MIEYFWLVEKFDLEHGRSVNVYLGETGQVKSAHDAKRMTEEEARAAAGNVRAEAGFSWRATEHGFHQ